MWDTLPAVDDIVLGLENSRVNTMADFHELTKEIIRSRKIISIPYLIYEPNHRSGINESSKGRKLESNLF